MIEIFLSLTFIFLASNKFRKKLQDKTVIEREEIVLELEMLEKRAPLQWYKNGQQIFADNQ